MLERLLFVIFFLYLNEETGLFVSYLQNMMNKMFMSESFSKHLFL